MAPLPTVNQAYAMIMSDKKQSIATNAGVLGSGPAGIGRSLDLAMFTRNGTQKFKKNYNLQCDFCKLKGHTKKNYWKLVGYPQDHKFKKRFRSEGANTTYKVTSDSQDTTEITTRQGSHSRSVQSNWFNDGCHQEESEMQLDQLGQMGTTAFTKEQYDQILKMINKNSGANTSTETTNAANAGISVFLASYKSRNWIIDTGATNHMVGKLDLLVNESITKIDKPRRVYLPNGDLTEVTHMGSSYDLCTGKVRRIGKLDGGLYLLVNTHEMKVAAATKVSTKADESKAQAKIQQFLEYVKTQFCKTVKVIRIDNGTAFVNSLCSSLFATKGIVHHILCSYSPQQNGVAERKHRHILEVTRALRFQATIPVKFWGYCVLAAVYLINRLPSSSIDYYTPYEKLYGTKPSCELLRVIGCFCYAKVLNESDKLMPRSRATVLMGYSSTKKGYVLYDISINVFFVSRDVSFREDVFPFKLEATDDQIPYHVFPLEDKYSAASDVMAPLQAPINAITKVYQRRSSKHQEVTQQDYQLQRVPNTTQPATQPFAAQDQKKSTRERKSPAWMNDFVSKNTKKVPHALANHVSYDKLSQSYKSFVVKNSSVTEPTSYFEACKDPRWVDAMKTEIEALNSNHTWEVVPFPKGKKTIGCRWIYKVKYEASGEVEGFKTRLVAKGYGQREGIDYKETFSPVVKMKTVRTILATAAKKNRFVHQMDVYNAFLNGDLTDEVYMELPQGFASQGENSICRLTKSLYGLKQTPRQWNTKLSEVLLRSQFVQSQYDPSLYIRRTQERITLVLVYVDDMLITGDSLKLIEDAKVMLQQSFKMKDLGELRFFLGIEFARSSKGILMHQRKYTLELLSELGLTAAKPVVTPMDYNAKLTSK
ncbi:hypothetical protein FXO38_35522 [Capsicum annuum]|nr:hypothetical protein FXO38_35522 [Capsicum annuum]